MPQAKLIPLGNFSNLAFDHAGIEIDWRGKGTDEKGVVRSLSSSFRLSSAARSLSSSSNLQPSTSTYDVSPSTSSLALTLNVGDVLVEIDPRYFRPLEVEFLQGDASKAKKKLGWEPKVKFKELAKIMVEADIKDLEEMRRCQDVIRKLANNKNIGG